MHVLHLPQGSAYYAALRGGQHWRSWGELEQQGLNLINANKLIAYILLMANRDPKKKAPDPPEWYPGPEERMRVAKLKLAEKRNPKPGSFAFMVGKAKRAKLKKVG
jgi:hypothetical protein